MGSGTAGRRIGLIQVNMAGAVEEGHPITSAGLMIVNGDRQPLPCRFRPSALQKLVMIGMMRGSPRIPMKPCAALVLDS
jgi:hypothetical protein